MSAPAFSAPLAARFSMQPVKNCAGMAEPPHTKARARGPELQAEGARSVPVVREVPNGKGLDGTCANRMSSVVFEVFVVVVLALYTKRLVMGITVSTLLLFLLERMGMVIPGLLKRRPCVRRARDVRNPRYKRASPPFVFEGTERFHFAEEEVGDGGFNSVGPGVAGYGYGSDGPPGIGMAVVPRQEEDCLGSKNKSKIMKRFVPIKMRNQKGESRSPML